MHTGGIDLRHVSFEGVAAAARRGDCIAASSHPSAARVTVIGDDDSVPDDHFGRWLLGRAGMDPDIYRLSSLHRRLPACLRALQVMSTDAARELIDRRPERLGAAIAALLIGVTEFFRDAHVLTDLQAAVIPALSRTPGPLRAWSAGCSSGQELYSLAILVAEAGLLDRTSLVGTDCREDAIAAARAGVYTAQDVEPLDPLLRDKYFVARDGGWQVVDHVRRSVQWRVGDLWTNPERGPFDLIAWRNVAIYLNPEPALRIMSQLVAALGPGGFLVLGKVERAPAGLGLVPFARCVYRKPGGPDVT